MMKKLFYIWCIIFSMTTTAFAVPSLHFATEATYPPFEYVDATGQLKGFDIDIAKALCQQMQVPCQFSNQAFNSLIPSLKVGRFDAVISALGITQERLQQVAFTDSYYEPSASFVAHINSHFQLLDIVGKIVGVQGGSTFDRYLRAKYGSDVTIKSYASIQDAFLDLVAERVDTVIADTPIATTWLKQNENAKRFSIVGKPVVDHEYFGTGYGIAVRKDNIALLERLNKALTEIKRNGTYQKLLQQYFGI